MTRFEWQSEFANLLGASSMVSANIAQTIDLSYEFTDDLPTPYKTTNFSSCGTYGNSTSLSEAKLDLSLLDSDEILLSQDYQILL